MIESRRAFARRLHQELAAKRNQCGAIAIGEESKVANANERSWQHM